MASSCMVDRSRHWMLGSLYHILNCLWLWVLPAINFV
jgi:hypothetical protein